MQTQTVMIITPGNASNMHEEYHLPQRNLCMSYDILYIGLETITFSLWKETKTF